MPRKDPIKRKEYNIEYNRRLREKKRDEINAYNRIWCQNHPESCKRWRTNYYQNNKQKEKNRSRNKHLISKYNITLEHFTNLLKLHNNKCSICNIEFSEKIYPCIDHNHETGKIRGILCSKCNTALGFFKDSRDLLKKAVGYLNKEVHMMSGFN